MVPENAGRTLLVEATAVEGMSGMAGSDSGRELNAARADTMHAAKAEMTSSLPHLIHTCERGC